jgi:hypothetical protein
MSSPTTSAGMSEGSEAWASNAGLAFGRYSATS